MLSHELGELAVQTGIWPLWQVEDGKLSLIGKTRDIADGRLKRLPVRDYLLKQGRFAHFTEDDIEYFQSKVDAMWTKWLIPGVIPFTIQPKDQTILKIEKKPLHEQKTA
jgi:pyruvate ferredoxin oxidoreductase beta subunit